MPRSAAGVGETFVAFPPLPLRRHEPSPQWPCVRVSEGWEPIARWVAAGELSSRYLAAKPTRRRHNCQSKAYAGGEDVRGQRPASFRDTVAEMDDWATSSRVLWFRPVGNTNGFGVFACRPTLWYVNPATAMVSGANIFRPSRMSGAFIALCKRARSSFPNCRHGVRISSASLPRAASYSSWAN